MQRLLFHGLFTSANFAGQKQDIMKPPLIIFIVATFTICSYCKAASTANTTERKLNLLHGSSSVSPRSTFEPVLLYINQDGDLRVQINQHQGEVLIQIKNSTNTLMYEYMVISSHEKEINIQSSPFPEGTYIIYFLINETYYLYTELQIE